MKRYTKTEIAQAYQWFDGEDNFVQRSLSDRSFGIVTAAGYVKINPGCWIVKNQYGGIEVVSDILFKELYKEIEE